MLRIVLYSEFSQKTRFLHRTERGFQCANSQSDSDKNLAFEKRHVIWCTVFLRLAIFLHGMKRGIVHNHKVIFYRTNWLNRKYMLAYYIMHTIYFVCPWVWVCLPCCLLRSLECLHPPAEVDLGLFRPGSDL